MNPEFWLSRWQKNETGFHLPDVNPHLLAHWPSLELPAGRVFVPLCGKTVDMHWLNQQGREVLGVELSRLAAEAFFAEAEVPAHAVQDGSFERWGKQQTQILCGDFFHLSAQHVADCTVIYDRAALIALPPVLRSQYVRHLRSLFPQGAQMLLVTLDYPQHEMDGPPFDVSVQEVQALYANFAEIKLLASHDVLSQNERFRQRGVSRLSEHIFHIELAPCNN